MAKEKLKIFIIIDFLVVLLSFFVLSPLSPLALSQNVDELLDILPKVPKEKNSQSLATISEKGKVLASDQKKVSKLKIDKYLTLKLSDKDKKLSHDRKNKRTISTNKKDNMSHLKRKVSTNKNNVKKSNIKSLPGSKVIHSASKSSFNPGLIFQKKLPNPRNFFGKFWGKKQTAPSNFIDIVRVQIYLDELDYSPGVIDGSNGYFTKKAVENFNSNFGLNPNDWQYIIKESRKSYDKPFTRYIISGRERNFLKTKLPYKISQQGNVNYLGYRSMLELLAEKFHCSTTFLKKINSGKNLYSLKVGDDIIVPKVTPFEIEKIPRDKSILAVSSGADIKRVIDVNTKEKIMRIIDNKVVIASFPITPGKEKYIPRGSWKIKIMITTPTFRYDSKMLKEGVRGKNYIMLPRGPNSPVGIFWAGISKSGIGFHGTSEPETIGRSRSAGCIRLTNWDVLRLPYYVRPGVDVYVH